LCSLGDDGLAKRELTLSIFSKDQSMMTELVNSFVSVAKGWTSKSLKPLAWTKVSLGKDSPQAMYL
jgi:hypothetical protein